MQVKSFPFLSLRQGFEGAFTGKSTREGIIERLRQYSLESGLDVISKLASLLLFRSPDDSAFTVASVNGVLGYKAGRVLAKVNQVRSQYAAEGSNSTVSVFENAQLLVAAKLSLRFLKSSTESPTSIVRLGEALLMISDLVGRQFSLPKSTDATDPDVMKAWMHFFALNGLFNVHEDRIHLLTRSYDLFFHAEASESGSVNIPLLLRSATGFSPIDYWTVAFSFLAHWSSIQLDNVGTLPSFISRKTYFTENFTFTEGEVDKFFNQFSRSADELRAELEELPDDQLWAGYYPLPLAGTPLVTIQDKVYCPIPRLLLERMTDGLYHTLLNALLPEQRNQFQIQCGKLFECYVGRLLARVYSVVSKRKHGRYINEAALGEVLGGPHSTGFSDGLIVGTDTIIVIEAKAARLSLARRTGFDAPGTIQKLREIYGDALKQIHSTISAINAGKLESLGIPADRPYVFIPLVVTLEHVPLRGIIYTVLDEFVEADSAVSGPGIRPWQTLHVSELEAAEGAMLAGHSLIDFLVKKAGHPVFSREGATNYCHAVQDPFLTKFRSPYLEDKFRELSDNTTLAYRRRAKNESEFGADEKAM